ncbi:MAG: phosphate ABC transporter ATP-binding protein [Oscillospiraceae bacterium]|nr:phosphate ABC transporter ATP-binding protein [Oscillospiraceae bacterium]
MASVAKAPIKAKKAKSENKIEITDLNFYYGEKRVIENLNLKIRANQVTSIFGPANSGTTTLLRALNRLSDLNHEARMEGKILIDGQDINAPEINVTELRRRIGFVFEVPTPLPMSIYDNVTYGLKFLRGKSRSEIAEIAEWALINAALWEEVKDRLHDPAFGLSGGQQQRMCVARVLALKPEIVLIDRSCSGLDPISTAKIEESLMRLKKEFTVIISPHNIAQASRVSDRVAFMLMGELVEEGTNSEIFTNPKDPRTSDYITGRFG